MSGWYVDVIKFNKMDQITKRVIFLKSFKVFIIFNENVNSTFFNKLEKIITFKIVHYKSLALEINVK